MNPQPGTPLSNFRIPLDLKAKAKARAAREGTTLTAIIVTALEEYVKGEGDE